MRKKHTIVLGYAPTRREMYDKAFALENKERISASIHSFKEENIEIADIEWLNQDGLLMDLNDVEKVEKRFRQAKVDGLFMPHCNFGTEEVVAKLGKALGVPFLLWGPRDETPPANRGERQTDCQCGLFASSKVLMRYGVPFTYIENCRTTDKAFKQGFMDFIKTASVVKAFRNMRIGQICQRPKPFLSVMMNESELLEKFGIEIIPIGSSEVISLVKHILEDGKREVKEIVDDIKKKIDCSAMSDERMGKIAALELAIMKLADQYNCHVMASECWHEFWSSLGIRACFVFGDVTDRGLPVACETDIHGAVTSALLTAAAMGKTPNFLADLTLRHPDNDNAELLWHCGPFPKSLAKEGVHPFMADCKGQWELQGGDITIARFDGYRGKYSLFADHAKGVEGPATNGNYLWVETDNWPQWEKKFICGPYIHHVAAIHGKYAHILHEACRYMGDVMPDHA